MPFFPCSRGIIHASYINLVGWDLRVLLHLFNQMLNIENKNDVIYIYASIILNCTTSTRCRIQKEKKWYHLFLCLYLYFSAVLLIKKICSCCIILIPQFRSWWFYYILNDHKSQHLLKSWNVQLCYWINFFFFMYDSYVWVKYIFIYKFSELSSFIPKNKVHG